MEQIALGLFAGLLVIGGVAGIVLVANLLLWLGVRLLSRDRDRGHDQEGDSSLQRAVAAFVLCFGILAVASVFVRAWFGDIEFGNIANDSPGEFWTGFVTTFFVVMAWAGFWEWRRINHVKWTKEAMKEFFDEKDQSTKESRQPTDSAPRASV